MSTMMNQPVAPPTPQEVQRKLSLKSASSPVPITPGRRRTVKNVPTTTTGGASSAESDSDNPSGSHFSPPQTTAAAELAPSQPPLNTITEKLDQSGGESDDDEDMGEWRAGPSYASSEYDDHNHNDAVTKSGYLWKKGERRKNWKKRWFVLRTAKLAVYKTDQEYVLLRMLDMHDVHSATVVTLKKHVNTFALVTPSRTYYLQAEDSYQCHTWVKAFNEVRAKLREEDLTPLVRTPRNSSVAALSTSAAAATSTIAERRNITGKGHALPSIVTSPSSKEDLGNPSGVESSRPHVPHSPTSLMALSSDEDDPFTLSQPLELTRRLTASNIANTAGGAAPAAVLDPKHIIIRGYLMKLGSKRKTWHKRWFMLTSDRLAYSKSHIDTKHTKHVTLDKVVDAIEFVPTAKHGHQPPGFYSSEGGSSTATPAAGAPSSLEKGGGSMQGGLPSSYGAVSAVSESGASVLGGVSSSVGSRGPAGLSGASSQVKNTFKIITTKRPFFLSAPSEEEEIRWLSAVRALIARRSS